VANLERPCGQKYRHEYMMKWLMHFRLFEMLCFIEAILGTVCLRIPGI